ncbi:IS3 family transposase, partial [Streptomyces sp. NPDC079020]|uniref:IS3 family transposase n=1 Tax=Streptomyces sp. NPDC079020 TaxID=3365722 RepID=UPI0037D562E1
FEYIDGFYNSRRIQERLGFLSPIEFEERHYAEQATAKQANLNARQPVADQLISDSRVTGEPHCAARSMGQLLPQRP